MSLCLDFDGVIAKYPSGEIVPGAIEFIRRALKECSELSVFSTRSGTKEGINHMGLYGLTLEEANKDSVVSLQASRDGLHRRPGLAIRGYLAGF